MPAFEKNIDPVIRPAAVAGMFYPENQAELEAELKHMLQHAEQHRPPITKQPKAIIVPHAGYVYSGQTAADAYIWLKPFADKIKRVVLLGPAHRVGFSGIACPDATHFETPLGMIPLDLESLERARTIEGVGILAEAHRQEHSLEVQLPFLQSLLGQFTLAPFVVGDAPEQLTASLISLLWCDEETLIVVSSDLSHYLDYQTASQRNANTVANIESFHGERIGPYDACGAYPLRGLLRVAGDKHLKIKRVSMCNSGDVTGDKSQVVGYASFVLLPA
ncbi:MAG: AmmeMemoRadiSam system protein B [Thiotrichales bacterium]